MKKNYLIALLVVGTMAFGCKKDEDKAPAKNDTPEVAKTVEPTPEGVPEEAVAAEPMMPAFAAVITHKVADFDKWKAGFDGHMEQRKGAGILGHHVSRDMEDANLVTVYMPMNETEKFTAMLGSDDMKKAMTEAGVQGEPTITMIKPVENKVVMDRDIAGMVMIFEVENFETFMGVFHAHGEAMTKAGILGTAVNRGVENENQIIVLLQADTSEAIMAFMGLPEIQESMGKASIKGETQTMMLNSTAGAMY